MQNVLTGRQKAHTGQVLLTAVLTFTICLLISSFSYAQSASDTWAVESIEGSARIAEPGQAAQPLNVGASVPFGAEVTTGDGARVVLRREDDSVVISPNSSMNIVRTDNPSMFTQIKQALGTLLFRVEPGRSRRFEVETPYLAATVKGTVFTVSVRTEGASVHVTEGAVQVASIAGQRSIVLRPGQTGFVSSEAGAEVEIRQQGGQRNEAPADNNSQATESDGNSGQSQQAAERSNGNANATQRQANGRGNGNGLALGRTIGNDQADFSKLTKGLAGNAGANGRAAAPGQAGKSTGKALGNANGKGRGNATLQQSAHAGGASPGLSKGVSNRNAGLGNVLKAGAPSVTSSSPGNSGNAGNGGAGRSGAGSSNAGGNSGIARVTSGSGRSNSGQSSSSPGQVKQALSGGGSPGNSGSAGGGNPNAGGGNPNAGGGNANAGGGNGNAGGGNGKGKGKN